MEISQPTLSAPGDKILKKLDFIIHIYSNIAYNPRVYIKESPIIIFLFIKPTSLYKPLIYSLKIKTCRIP